MVRIRSEHAIGFLKGRFHSLKKLRVRIKDKKSHKFATYWVAACIGIHSFAMMCEAEERGGDDEAASADPFITEGLSDSSDSSDDPAAPSGHLMANRCRLLRGKEKREKLKKLLFRSKARRAERRAQERSLEESDEEMG